MDEWMDRWVGGEMMDRWMDEWMDRWVGGEMMDRWMDGRLVDGQIHCG